MTRLFLIAGTPSPALYATMNVLRTLVQVAVGDHNVIVANAVEDLKREIAAQESVKTQPVILFSDYPDPKMLTLYLESKAPIAICMDDFTTTAHYAAVTRELGGVVAARFAMMGLVNLEPAIITPPARGLFVRDLDVGLAALIRRLAMLYDLPQDDGLPARTLAYLGLADRPAVSLRDYAAQTLPAFDGARDMLERRSPLENELIDGLAPFYDELFQGRPLRKLEWPAYALLRPEYPDRLKAGPIDLTGPARVFYYGPYFALPAGMWQAEITLEVQDCHSDNEIAIDAFSEGVRAMIKTKLPPRGVYGCRLAFDIPDPSKPVEIRLQLLTGAIEGVLALSRIALTRLPDSDRPSGVADDVDSQN